MISRRRLVGYAFTALGAAEIALATHLLEGSAAWLIGAIGAGLFIVGVLTARRHIVWTPRLDLPWEPTGSERAHTPARQSPAVRALLILLIGVSIWQLLPALEGDGSADRSPAVLGDGDPFHIIRDDRSWSVEGRYHGTVRSRPEGVLLDLDSARIQVHAAHAAPIYVGAVRAALGRRVHGHWTFHATSDWQPIGRWLAPGEDVRLDRSADFRIRRARVAWLDSLHIVFEHTLLPEPGAEPYGWTWASRRLP